MRAALLQLHVGRAAGAAAPQDSVSSSAGDGLLRIRRGLMHAAATPRRRSLLSPHQLRRRCTILWAITGAWPTAMATVSKILA